MWAFAGAKQSLSTATYGGEPENKVVAHRCDLWPIGNEPVLAWGLRVTRRQGIFAALAGLFGCKPTAEPMSAVTPEPSARNGVQIFTEEFKLVLAGDWRELPSDDPNRVLCESATLKTSIVISVLFTTIPSNRLVYYAEQLWKSREAAERAVRPDVTFFADRFVGFRDTDQAGHVAYGGQGSGAIFRFFGWTTERKILSFWISTETEDAATADRIQEEVMRNGFAMAFP